MHHDVADDAACEGDALEADHPQKLPVLFEAQSA